MRELHCVNPANAVEMLSGDTRVAVARLIMKTGTSLFDLRSQVIAAMLRAQIQRAIDSMCFCASL